MCQLCSMKRRRFLGGFAAATGSLLGAQLLGGAGALLTATSARAAESVILGQGRYRYRILEGWGELPPGVAYGGDAAAVCVDSKDNVYVFTRGAHPVIVFDRNGKFLRSWGQDVGFTNPLMQRTSVDFPVPDGPMMAVMPDPAISAEMPLSTGFPTT